MNILKHKKQILFLIVLFFMLLILVLGGLYYKLVAPPLLSLNESPVIIVLHKATTASQFVTTLKKQKLITSRKAWLALIRYEGLSQKLKAGVYQINPGETALQVLHRVTSGDVMSFNFTLIAGTTLKKIDQDLKTAAYLEYTPNVWDAFNLNHPNAEGLFLADTYRYVGGSDASTVLSQAQRNLMIYLNECWSTRDPNVPYKTPYDLLVAASIIEKETAVPEERKLISGVVVNRLKKNMPLQMDPTVIYALGDSYKGTLAHDDLSVISPYNTYKNRGLPPTPIATVGKQAIDAAAHPQRSNYLYFYAKGDGTHQFSQSYEEQKQAINQYRHKGL
jgi:UPF0755 protein